MVLCDISELLWLIEHQLDLFDDLNAFGIEPTPERSRKSS